MKCFNNKINTNKKFKRKTLILQTGHFSQKKYKHFANRNNNEPEIGHLRT